MASATLYCLGKINSNCLRDVYLGLRMVDVLLYSLTWHVPWCLFLHENALLHAIEMFTGKEAHAKIKPVYFYSFIFQFSPEIYLFDRWDNSVTTNRTVF